MKKKYQKKKPKHSESDDVEVLRNTANITTPKTLKDARPASTREFAIWRKLQSGMKSQEVADACSVSLASVYTVKSLVNKGKIKLPHSAPANEESEESDSDDAGLGFQAIGLIVDAKRNTNKSDQEIASEFDVTPDQVRMIYKKWQGDPRFTTD